MRRHQTLVALWILSDAAIFIGTYALAYFIRVGWILSTDFPLSKLLAVIVGVTPFWLMILLALGVFHPLRNQKTLVTLSHIITATLLGVALFTLGYYFRFTAFFSRLLLIEAFFLSSIGIWAWHIIMQRIIRHILRSPPLSFPTLIIGATRETARLIHTLERQRSPLTPIGILDSRSVREERIAGVPVLGKLNILDTILTEKSITHLIQCSNVEHTINLLSACRMHDVTYMLLPSVLGIMERDERIESLEGFHVTVVRPRASWWSFFFI
ncbi:hypothetical protein A3H22_03410 [Candidatus Peribacteria bacterium RIFCSPLOWO2_12_FULL_55_15]|nr:MAG: hypothetical protein A2789_01065 [Candidatus Peribacteria bacterium RIFCSPHIGHO2_01_FULL_54_22]OGJ62222.1 MAG: hypothetical protein A3D12_00180 [Candidatus Peribacteria bacterium RIFCSPHIGHO2_02_FULL_55_24]OGJ64137.1 MAG: hypothetical protein A3E47_03750 [Candidatus Peribacteria bacterium RIFCSPHIGHO2_12_FULL_54_10]OGJ69062.1 MAG: hypothetical protein A2947_00315 [Candidatus Peribacteria bacterium RIFCSPLOWO2_01_FULL_54_110]OGJ69942.1 MAG: hypothetical protein A3H90_00965 [Candidatus Pe